MNMPGFTAEVCVYKPTRCYSARAYAVTTTGKGPISMALEPVGGGVYCDFSDGTPTGCIYLGGGLDLGSGGGGGGSGGFISCYNACSRARALCREYCNGLPLSERMGCYNENPECMVNCYYDCGGSAQG